MKKILIILLFLQNISCSQNVDLRNLTLNSDVILFVESKDVEYFSKTLNDHYNKSLLIVNSFQKIIKDNKRIKFLKKEIFVPKEENDFYDDDKLNGGGCMAINMEVAEPDKKYYQILFIKKKKQQLELLARFWRKDFEWEDLILKIEDVKPIEDAKTLQESYEKSIDYYLKYDEMPDYEFIFYYQNKKILNSDSLKLTEKQLIFAKERFLNGNERNYDLIRNTYPNEISSYYIKKMKKISQTEDEEEISFFDFQEAFERATQTGFMDDSEMGKLKDKLTKECVFEHYKFHEITFEEKQKIMKTLIENAENKNYR